MACLLLLTVVAIAVRCQAGTGRDDVTHGPEGTTEARGPEGREKGAKV